MSEFSRYVTGLLIQRNQDSSLINEIFTYIEFFLINGDKNVQNAVATCFLKNILNVTPEKLIPNDTLII